MATRIEPHDSLDYFPTPPWATRALCEAIASHFPENLKTLTAWEPACGEGHMARPLREYFGDVFESDITAYAGTHEVGDFRFETRRRTSWIITNPPFPLAERFARHALFFANVGVALLVRTTSLKGSARFAELYAESPPTEILQFVERVPMIKGRLDQHASTATSYCWLIWRAQPADVATRFRWINPSRKRLERATDYNHVDEKRLGVFTKHVHANAGVTESAQS